MEVINLYMEIICAEGNFKDFRLVTICAKGNFKDNHLHEGES